MINRSVTPSCVVTATGECDTILASDWPMQTSPCPLIGHSAPDHKECSSLCFFQIAVLCAGIYHVCCLVKTGAAKTGIFLRED